MIKRYCDGCGEGMRYAVNEHQIDHDIVKPDGSVVNVKVKIIRAVAGVWNGGDICITCIRDVVADGKIQPAAAKGIEA